DIALLTGVSGTNMIGQSVVFGSNLLDHTETGNGTFYQLTADAVEVTAYITDVDGNEVRTVTGLSGDSTKEIDFEWDGLDDNGQPVDYAEYGIRFEATDADGNSVPVYVYRTAEVEEVLFEGGAIFYAVSGDEILTSDAVLALRPEETTPEAF
ncbi:flagellar hook assembly protein FlgD, partial [Shimia sp.]|uniref:flagellar hook assembly protein FlgD n=1 Tax=Shimia sp. TaxID=1954381 RepID=UPI00356271AF